MSQGSSHRKGRKPSVHPRLERLEERQLLATFTVTSNGDPVGIGLTLRQAIMMANTTPGADTINFAIVGPPVIVPTSSLPPITDTVTIDGTTQAGVTINGSAAGASDGLVFMSSANGSVLRGITITSFAHDGVVLSGVSNVTVGGTSAAARNVINHLGGSGVLIDGGSSNVVLGNYIGLDSTGNVRIDNGGNGVLINGGSGDVIGGTSSGARNVLSGNDGDGVRVNNASGVSILGNYIGTNAGGNVAVGNNGRGVTLNGSTDSTTVGGAAAGAGNVISGNGTDGISIFAFGAGNAIQGNRIGTNAAGNAGLGNDGNGIGSFGAGVLIGGGSTAAGNVISANAGFGVFLVDENSVQFNIIGATADGVSDLGNGDDGINIDGSDNLIGTPASGNIIAYNGTNPLTGSGVAVVNSPFNLRNAIRGNNIFLNDGLGIDLGEDGVTPNDLMDLDVGPNNFQNFPDLTSVSLSGSTATISGTLNSTPLSTFIIDFFASQIWDPTEFGEGQKYLGSTTVTTDGSGNASFTATVGGVPAGYNFFAATATDLAGNTSEFDHDPVAAAPSQPARKTAHHQKKRERDNTHVWQR